MTTKHGFLAGLSLGILAIFAGTLLWKGSTPARATGLVSCTFSFPSGGGARLLSIPNDAQFQVGASAYGPYSPTALASEVLTAIPGFRVAQWVDTTVTPHTAYCWPTAASFGGGAGNFPATDCVDPFGTAGVPVDFQVASLAALLHFSNASTPASVTISGASQPTPPSIALAGGVTHFLTGPFAWPVSTWGTYADELIDKLLVPRPMPGTFSILRYLPTSPPSVEFWTGYSGVNFPLACDEGFQLTLAGAGANYYWP